jgi:copper transport protein
MRPTGEAGAFIPRRLRVVARPAAILVLAGSLVLLPAREASAHAFLVSASPQPGARLKVSPPSVKLQFSEPVAGGERVLVKTQSGTPVATAPVQQLQGGLVIEASLPKLGEGIYIVSWQVVGSDGDLTLGEYAFAIGTQGPIPTESAQSGPVAWPESVATWVLLTGLLVAFGGLASEFVIWSRLASSAVQDVPRLPVMWLLAFGLVGAVAQLIMFAARTMGRGPPGRSGWTTVLASRPGGLAVAEIVLIAYGLWLILVPVRRARLWALVPLGLAVISAALRGHEGTTSTWWAGPADAVHLLAVGLWLGALAHLVIVAWRVRDGSSRSIVAEGARRYAAFALAIVGVVLLSGAVVALTQFTDLTQLPRTRYGQILLIKILLVGCALVLAMVARMRALSGDASPRIELLHGLTKIESLALVGAVAVAAVLGNAPTPRSASTSALSLGPPPLQGPVLRLAGLTGSMAIYVAGAENQLQVVALAPGGVAAADATIEVRGSTPGGLEIGVAPRSCGPGCVTTAFPWQEGTTSLAVTASSGEWGAGTVHFEMPWPPQREDPDLLNRVIEAMRSQPKLTLTESVTSGPGTGGQYRIETTGPKFIATEPFAGGGVTDVRPLPSESGRRRLTLYLPGSSIWFLLVIDRQGRLRRETAVDPGHLIQRTFTY